MEIIRIISEHKKINSKQPLRPGFKRVEAIIKESGKIYTRHIDINKTYEQSNINRGNTDQALA